MFLFLCSFSIAFWGCLVLFYSCLRFIKNFQIIREEFPFFSQFFTIHLNCCGGLAIVRNPGGRHSQALVGYATLPSVCTDYARSVSQAAEPGFYAPSMAHNALPSRPWPGISAPLSIILTDSKQLRYALQ